MYIWMYIYIVSPNVNVVEPIVVLLYQYVFCLATAPENMCVCSSVQYVPSNVINVICNRRFLQSQNLNRNNKLMARDKFAITATDFS